MADNYLSKTGLAYFYDRLKRLFASQTALNNLSDRVDSIIAEGGEPNVIETVQKNGTALPVTNKTVNVTVPTKVSDLTNDSGFLTTETDPTVPAWAKAASKPSYTADEITITGGDYADVETALDAAFQALDNLDVPTNTSDLTNDGDGTSPFATQAYVAQNGGKIDTIKVNGTTQTITNKAVDISVPTKTSDITNDTNYVSDASYVHTDSNYTAAEKNKLANIASGAEVNVQSDWDVADSTSDAFIKNKPSIPTKTSDITNDSNFVSDASYVHTDNNFTTTLKNKLDGIASGAEVNVQSDWNVTSTSSDAFIKNKPTNVSAFTNDAGYLTSYTETDPTVPAWAKEASKPSYTASEITYDNTEAYYEATAVQDVLDEVGFNLTEMTGRLGAMEINLATKVPNSSVGVANGIATLGSDGKVPTSQLPSYVDDVIEAYPISGATELSASWLSATSGGSVLTPETGKIYVLMAASTSYAANTTFRWSGSTYVKLSDAGLSAITTAEIDAIIDGT